jgi:hypothetical protein
MIMMQLPIAERTTRDSRVKAQRFNSSLNMYESLSPEIRKELSGTIPNLYEMARKQEKTNADSLEENK